MSLRLPLRRRRGMGYTVIVMGSSILILATASVLLRASGHAFSLTAMDARRTQGREAAFSGLRWAQAHADRSGPEPASVELSLNGAQVAVRCERDGQVLEVVSETVGIELTYVLTARLVPDPAGRYQPAGFALESRATSARDASGEPPR
ncbi:MAG: hypothetical protein KDD82_27165 [Planctomycetes bacterium]|nr:hypothetical protein [Planctomycetota bacterium]